MKRLEVKRKRWPLAMRIGAAGLAVLLMSACGKEPEELVSSAKLFIADGNAEAAAIQLKNVLQDKPEHAEARFLLAQIKVSTGDFAAAIKDFERAASAGIPDAQVLPAIAHAMLAMGNATGVIDRFAAVRMPDAATSAKLLNATGEAYLLLGQIGPARMAFEKAVADEPRDLRGRIGLAQVKVGEKDLEGAKKDLSELLALSPASGEAHAVLGTIAQIENNTEAAIAAFRQATSNDPKQASYHYRLISALLGQGSMEQAKADLALMKKAVGGTGFYAVYLQAYVDFVEGRDRQALEGITKVVRAAPDFLPARLLSGQVHLRSRDVNQALQDFGAVLKLQPDNVVARRAVVGAHLLALDPDSALEKLGPLLRDSPEDPTVLSLAGQAHLARGDFDRSSEFFERAVKKQPDDAATRLQLGVSRLGAGATDQALVQLEKAASLDDGGVRADVALAMAHLRQRDVDKALQAVARIEAKQPKNPLGHNLRGGALLARGDVAGARTAFEKALKLNPSYLPTVVNLARLDLQAKQPELARARLTELVAARPDDVNALLALAHMLELTGAKRAEIRGLLEKGIQAAPEASSLRLSLARLHAANGDHRAALEVSQRALQASPDNPELLMLVGGAQLGSNQALQAVSTYTKLVSVQPSSAPALILLGRAQLAAGDLGGAEQSLSKAYKQKPDLREASASLVALKLAQSDFRAANLIAQDLKQRFPKAPDGDLLLADIALKQSDWAGAVRALRSAQAITPTVKHSIAIHAALSAAGDEKAAAREAQQWLQQSPTDLGLRNYLAELDLRKGNYQAAAQAYQSMLAISPDNSLVLNNLAWAAAQLKDPKAAEYAEKALALAPDNAVVLDTLGMIQLEAGDKKQAIAHLRRASELAPGSVPIALNLARAYGRNGDTAMARSVLARLEFEGGKNAGLKEDIAKIRAGL